MRKIFAILGFTYFVSAIVLVPILANVLWDIFFSPHIDKGAAISGVLKIVMWLVGVAMILKAILSNSLATLKARIRSVAPDDFTPGFELIGTYPSEYIGMDPQRNRIVIVDLRQGKARCEPIDFLQGWAIEERGIRTTLVFRFNDFDFSTVGFSIPRWSSDDIAAKLIYATRN